MIIYSQTFPGIRALFPFHSEFLEMNPRMERNLDEMT